MIRALSGFVLALSLLLPAASARAEFVVPPLTGAVVDRAQMLSPDTVARLETALRDLWNAGGSQIAVLTVPELGGVTIEQASIQVVDQWKLGTAKGDNGILLMVSKAERSARIEVGQGLEGTLPDAYARRIIDDVLVPEFKAGNYDRGVINAVFAIAQRTDPDHQLGIGKPRREAAPTPANPWFTLVVFLFIFGFALLPRLLGFAPSYRGRRGYWSNGGWGGGGGGGFGGGGGGFSGGGASGKW